jgi:hypothetical protein
MYNINIFFFGIYCLIYINLHISILICGIIKLSLFSRNVPFTVRCIFHLLLYFLYDITSKVAFLIIKLNDGKWKFYILISVYDVKIWIRTHSSLYIILSFGTASLRLYQNWIFLGHTCNERTKYMTKVSKQTQTFQRIHIPN